MKALGKLLALIAVGSMLAGCGVTIITGSGRVITERRNVSGFSAVTLAGLGDIVITQGSSESLSIEAEDNVMPQIKTEVTGGNLVIRFDTKDWRDVIRPTKPIKFTVGLKNLNAVELSGVGNIQAAGVKTDRLVIKISGAGMVKLERLEANEISTILTGMGNSDLAGLVTKQEVDMSGAGAYSAGNLSSQTVKIKVTGTGNATVWVRDSLDVTISGAGNVSYYGNPKITKSITGLGVLNTLGSK